MKEAKDKNKLRNVKTSIFGRLNYEIWLDKLVSNISETVQRNLKFEKCER